MVRIIALLLAGWLFFNHGEELKDFLSGARAQATETAQAAEPAAAGVTTSTATRQPRQQLQQPQRPLNKPASAARSEDYGVGADGRPVWLGNGQ